ncbi:uncharacterized protein PHACADRAFT_262217, partial [Phanerochaete carnosa HHB-10118-sp]
MPSVRPGLRSDRETFIASDSRLGHQARMQSCNTRSTDDPDKSEEWDKVIAPRPRCVNWPPEVWSSFRSKATVCASTVSPSPLPSHPRCTSSSCTVVHESPMSSEVRQTQKEADSASTVSRTGHGFL